jgi:predicted deacetylase
LKGTVLQMMSDVRLEPTGKHNRRTGFSLRSLCRQTNQRRRQNRTCTSSQCKEKLDSLGLETSGFIAPMWSMGSAMLNLLHDLGFEFTETSRKLIDLTKQRVFKSFVCSYHVGNQVMNRSLLALNWVNFQAKMRRHALLRLAIDPQDSDSALRQVMSFVSQLKREDYVFHDYHSFFLSHE